MSEAMGPCIPLKEREMLMKTELAFRIKDQHLSHCTRGITVADAQLLTKYVDTLIRDFTDADLLFLFSKPPKWQLWADNNIPVEIEDWAPIAYHGQTLTITLESRLRPFGIDAKQLQEDNLMVKLSMASDSPCIRLPTISGLLQIVDLDHTYMPVSVFHVTAEEIKIPKKRRGLVYHVTCDIIYLLSKANVLTGAILDYTSSSHWTTGQMMPNATRNDLMTLDWHTERDKSVSELGLSQGVVLLLRRGYTVGLDNFAGWGSWGAQT